MKVRIFSVSLGIPVTVSAAITYVLVVSETFYFNVAVALLIATVILGLSLSSARKQRKYSSLQNRVPDPMNGALFSRADAIRKRMGLKPVNIFIVKGQAKAFARTLMSRSPTILISSKMLEALTPAEQDSILAHELAHVRHSHITKSVVTYISYWVAGTEFFLFAGSGLVMDWTSLALLSGILLVLAGVLFTVPLVRRHFELEADLVAATIEGKEPLSSALAKLNSLETASPQPGKLRRLMRASPSISERLERIAQA